MTDRTRNILFLCTGNSARSILAEALMTSLGAPAMRGFSAGSMPAGAVHPDALRLLAEKGHDTAALRSKSWDEFAGPDTPVMDAIITVCDNAAGETCPIWPGRPAAGHWGLPDPAAVADAKARRQVFGQVYATLRARISALIASGPDFDSPETLAARLRDLRALGA